MAVPKRRHSKQRSGKRINARKVQLPDYVKCPHCNGLKLPHQICKKCGR